MINFVIMGGGWRAEFYLKIAKLVPDVFHVSGIYVRNAERREYLKKQYNVKVLPTVDETLSEDFDFIVNCISYDDVSDFSVELADQGYYVLCETPVLKEPIKGHNYEKIQVAEQYHQRGTYQAIKKLLNSGIIGDINHINISVAHDYHAMSILRFLLGEYDAPRKCGEYQLTDNLLMTHGREGEFDDKYLKNTMHRLIIFDFNSKTAIYDYNSEQYFSPIRQDRLLIRGTRGEIDNKKVRYFNKDDRLVESELVLKMSGALDGFHNRRIIFEDKVLYEFPFRAARLSEEEIAISACLLGMKKYIETGEEFYSYKRAYEDFAYFMQ